MSGQHPLREADLIYCYDGSLAGFFSCVFESFARRELPFAIWLPEEEQPSLCPVQEIPTDPGRAGRVRRGIREKLGPAAAKTAAIGFLSGQPDKELALLRYLHLGFGEGPGALKQLGRPEVAEALGLVRSVEWEAEKYRGFVRFEESGGMLGAVIHPKNHVLPLLRPFFCARLGGEDFLIYDAAHKEVLLHQAGKTRLEQVTVPLSLPEPDAAESEYQQLWKQFYETLAIAGRRNDRCRMTHCPKRFWADLTELRDQV